MVDGIDDEATFEDEIGVEHEDEVAAEVTAVDNLLPLVCSSLDRKDKMGGHMHSFP